MKKNTCCLLLLLLAGAFIAFGQTKADPTYYRDQLQPPNFESTARPVILSEYTELIEAWRIDKQLYIDKSFIDYRKGNGESLMTKPAQLKLARFLDQYPNWTVLLTFNYRYYELEAFINNELYTNTSIQEITRGNKAGSAVLLVNYHTVSSEQNYGYMAQEYYDDQKLGEDYIRQLRDPLVDNLRSNPYKGITDFISNIEEKALQNQRKRQAERLQEVEIANEEIELHFALINEIEKTYKALRDSLKATDSGPALNPDLKSLRNTLADAQRSIKRNDTEIDYEVLGEITTEVEQTKKDLIRFQETGLRLAQVRSQIDELDTASTAVLLSTDREALNNDYEAAHVAWRTGGSNYHERLMRLNEQLIIHMATHFNYLDLTSRVYLVREKLSALSEEDLMYADDELYEQTWQLTNAAIEGMEKSEFVLNAEGALQNMANLEHSIETNRQAARLNQLLTRVLGIFLVIALIIALSMRLNFISQRNRQSLVVLRKARLKLSRAKAVINTLKARAEPSWYNLQSSYSGDSKRSAVKSHLEIFKAHTLLEIAAAELASAQAKFDRGGPIGSLLLKFFSGINFSGARQLGVEKQAHINQYAGELSQTFRDTLQSAQLSEELFNKAMEEMQWQNWDGLLEKGVEFSNRAQREQERLNISKEGLPGLLDRTRSKHDEISREIRYMGNASYFRQSGEVALPFDNTIFTLSEVQHEIPKIEQLVKPDPITALSKAQEFHGLLRSGLKNFNRFKDFNDEHTPQLLEQIERLSKKHPHFSKYFGALNELLTSFDESLAGLLNRKLNSSVELLNPLFTFDKKIKEIDRLSMSADQTFNQDVATTKIQIASERKRVANKLGLKPENVLAVPENPDSTIEGVVESEANFLSLLHGEKFELAREVLTTAVKKLSDIETLINLHQHLESDFENRLQTSLQQIQAEKSRQQAYASQLNNIKDNYDPEILRLDAEHSLITLDAEEILAFTKIEGLRKEAKSTYQQGAIFEANNKLDLIDALLEQIKQSRRLFDKKMERIRDASARIPALISELQQLCEKIKEHCIDSRSTRKNVDRANQFLDAQKLQLSQNAQSSLGNESALLNPMKTLSELNDYRQNCFHWIQQLEADHTDHAVFLKNFGRTFNQLATAESAISIVLTDGIPDSQQIIETRTEVESLKWSLRQIASEAGIKEGTLLTTAAHLEWNELDKKISSISLEMIDCTDLLHEQAKLAREAFNAYDTAVHVLKGARRQTFNYGVRPEFRKVDLTNLNKAEQYLQSGSYSEVIRCLKNFEFNINNSLNEAENEEDTIKRRKARERRAQMSGGHRSSSNRNRSSRNRNSFGSSNRRSGSSSSSRSRRTSRGGGGVGSGNF